MAKKKTTTKKAVTEKPENKEQSFEVKETKKVTPPAKFNGGVIIDGKFYKMAEAKSRQMVKEGKAKLA